MRSSAARKPAASAARARFWGLAGLCLLVGACNVLLDLDEEQCRTNAECAERGLAGMVCNGDNRCVPADATPQTGPWACLGKVEFPSPKGGVAPFELQVRDIASNVGLAGASAKLCGRNDSACGSPFSPLTADAEGYLSWTVPDNFDGYAEVSLTGYATSLYYPQISYIRKAAGGRGPYVSLGKPETLEGLAQINQATRDPTAGDALIYVVDCDGGPAEGVRLETDALLPNTLPFYLVNRVPDGSATETDKVVGAGGYLNLPARLVSFRVYVAATGQTITNVSILVRPGNVTFAVVEPTS